MPAHTAPRQHLPNTWQENTSQLYLPLPWHLQNLQHGDRNAKQQQVAHERHRRIHAVHDPPLQTVENDQEQLGQESGHQDPEHDLDSDQEAVVEAANAIVKRQPRHATQQEGRCVDNVGGKVEYLGTYDDVDGQNVFDVSEMTSGSEDDELDTQADKGNE